MGGKWRKYRALVSILVAFLSAASLAGGQGLRPSDVPSTRSEPGSYGDLPLDPERRVELEKAVGSRDFARAENLLLQEVGKNPKSPALLATLGGIFFLDGHYLQCAIALKKAEALSPLDDRNRFTLALAYITLNHGNWARPELEKLAQANAQNPLYTYWLGRLDYDDMRFEAAITRFRKVLELDPRFMKGYDNLGLCYEALGRSEEAIHTYQAALRLNRDQPSPSPWPPLNLGTLLVKLGRLDEGKTALEEVLRYEPQFPRAHYQMGLLLEKEGKDSAAIEELKLAAKYDPTFPDPYYSLGRIYQRSGDKQSADAAFTTFQKLKKEKPTDSSN